MTRLLNKKDLAFLEERTGKSIHIDMLRDQTPRTLLVCKVPHLSAITHSSNDVLHVYIDNCQFRILRYTDQNVFVSTLLTTEFSLRNVLNVLCPVIRPERSDFEFCRLLSLLDLKPIFSKFDNDFTAQTHGEYAGLRLEELQGVEPGAVRARETASLLKTLHSEFKKSEPEQSLFRENAYIETMVSGFLSLAAHIERTDDNKGNFSMPHAPTSVLVNMMHWAYQSQPTKAASLMSMLA